MRLENPIPKSPLEMIPFKVQQPVQSVVAKYYIEWKMKRWGNPGKETPPNPEMPSAKNFMAMRRQKIIDEVLGLPGVTEYTQDPRIEIDRQKRIKEVLNAIDYEINIGVINKYDNPEAARTARAH